MPFFLNFRMSSVSYPLPVYGPPYGDGGQVAASKELITDKWLPLAFDLPAAVREHTEAKQPYSRSRTLRQSSTS